MYSLFVDDSAQAGQQAVATACQALAQGEPLPQVLSLATLMPHGLAARPASCISPAEGFVLAKIWRGVCGGTHLLQRRCCCQLLNSPGMHCSPMEEHNVSTIDFAITQS